MALEQQRPTIPIVLAPRALVELQKQWEAGVRVDRCVVIAQDWCNERTHTREASVRAVASALLRELHCEPRLLLPPPPPPLHRAVDKKLLADARLLMMLSKGERSPPPPPKAEKLRCGECINCMLRDCGECGNCLDKPRFGGRGVRKQACSKRRCMGVKASEKRVFS